MEKIEGKQLGAVETGGKFKQTIFIFENVKLNLVINCIPF
jgi:hypothetical protein